ncbi:MAG TPA: glycosyltransferase [Thermoanaerobaculia bacterium]|nr:glycosyltransferase [Thermoanaerobaculia bacterium]
MKIVYSYNKRGFEADMFRDEIAAGSDERYSFIPFNHEPYVETNRCIRAQLLDNLYYAKDPGLMRLYADIEMMIGDLRADALLVDNVLPYHPEFLRKLDVFKVMRTTDGPIAAYDRDFAYVHAYDQILIHSPAYSSELSMEEKLRYVGAKDVRFWPLGVFSPMYDHSKTAETILSQRRDIDILFIGVPHPSKMSMLAVVKKAFGSRCVIRGAATLKQNLYYNAMFGWPGWVRPVAFEEYVPLYQRTKIGFNIHNRGDYTVGSFRLFELPANGVMQISDGGEYLDSFFKVGEEIVRHRRDDLVDKIRFYLDHHDERNAIALAGYQKVMREDLMKHRLRRAGELIEDGIRIRKGAAERPVCP